MSTTIFSPRRFGLYLKQYIAANIKTWLLFALAAIGIMVIAAIFFILNRNLVFYNIHPKWYYFAIWNISHSIYYIGLFGLGLILTATSFNNLSTKRSGIFYLMLPSTIFEKLLAHWLVTVPIYLVVYELIWILTSIIINYISGLITPLHYGLYIPVGDSTVYLSYIFIQSFFFAGTVLTGKSSFIKTTLASLIMIFLIWLYVIGVNYLLFDGSEKFDLNIGFDLFSPSFHSSTLNNFMRPITILFIPVCYVLAYYFLKEKEV